MNLSKDYPRYRKEKVLTIVGAFFVAPNTVSVLGRNHYPDRTRIYKSCFKSKNEIEKPQGLIWKTGARKTASIKQNKRPGSKSPVWW